MGKMAIRQVIGVRRRAVTPAFIPIVLLSLLLPVLCACVRSAAPPTVIATPGSLMVSATPSATVAATTTPDSPTATATPSATATATATPSATATRSTAPDGSPTPQIAAGPLITTSYTADPSAHVFEGKLYIYPSHDLDQDVPETMDGGQYAMEDYHVFSLKTLQSAPVDHGQVLHVNDVPWAEKQMWAPDAAYKNGRYYLFFPAKDREGLFRIGVATSESPAGPFTAEPDFIAGSFSIDPCVFIDDDGQAYLYFGGLWGGQLERWTAGTYNADGKEPANADPALGPRIAKLSADMLSFDGPVGEILIVDSSGDPLLAGDHERRFFEGAWVHRYNGVYYLSYSTGDTHFLVYATGDSPTGPFVYRGRILEPVLGWTTHHSIVEFQGQWYLFYHDATLSQGVSHKRNIKVAGLTYDAGGNIIINQP